MLAGGREPVSFARRSHCRSMSRLFQRRQVECQSTRFLVRSSRLSMATACAVGPNASGCWELTHPSLAAAQQGANAFRGMAMPRSARLRPQSGQDRSAIGSSDRTATADHWFWRGPDRRTWGATKFELATRGMLPSGITGGDSPTSVASDRGRVMRSGFGDFTSLGRDKCPAL